MTEKKSNISEKLLVQECLKGNREAQEKLYRSYADKMFAVCKTYANDRDEACEYLQIGFIKVFESLKQYKSEGSLEGWVRRVIVNCILQEIRRKKIFHLNIEDVQVAEHIEENEGLLKLSFSKVVELINDLPTKAGLILKLYAIEGLSHKEIADNLEISVNTSKSQLNYARKLLGQKVNSISNE